MDNYTRHEALHTVDMIRELLYSRVIEHGYAESCINNEFNNKITTAFDALCDAYQLCNEDYEE